MDNIEDLYEKDFFKRGLIRQWEKFINSNPSLELLTQDEFLFYLDYEDIILGYEITYINDEMKVLPISNPIFKERDKEKLNTLRAVYNKRFGVEDNNEYEDHTRYTNAQILYLLDNLGLFQTDYFKSIVLIKDKQRLLSKILKCSTFTARDVWESKGRNIMDAKQKANVDKLLQDIRQQK
jgi:hypothetical protein